MSQLNQPSANPSVTRDGAGAGLSDPDPLRSLHKMSTTAGVATQEYVAINAASVWAAVLGLASLLALMEDMLLVIPILAVIFAMIALSQIRKSNGTETGRMWAIVGLVLALLTGGGRAVALGVQAKRNAADSVTISALVDQLSDSIKAGDFDKAYALFSSQFQQRVSHDKFVTQMQFLRTTQNWGKMTALKWSGRARFDEVPDQNIRFAESMIYIYFENSGSEPLQEGAVFRLLDGKWYFENIPQLFPAEKPSKTGM